MTLALLLVLAAPTFDAFDEPLDVRRWYIGVPDAPRKGWLRLPKQGWIVSRGVPDDRIRRLEIVFRHKGGGLAVTFHDAREPLSSPKGEELRVKRGRGVRTLVVTGEGALLDGMPLAWKGTLRGTFRCAALRGAVEIDEVRVEPRLAEPRELTELEKATVHFATTPPVYREGEAQYARASMLLWDVEVCFLLHRGEPGFHALKAPPKGAPVLGALVSAGNARTLALRASSHPLAMADWGDERGNLSRGAFLRYIQTEYATLALLLDAQRALNAALPERDDLEPLVHLAAIRHAANAHAALALAETQGAKGAVAAMRKALGKEDARRVSADRLRAAAAQAAREILGAPPAAWPGFQFDPSSRYVTMERAAELTR